MDKSRKLETVFDRITLVETRFEIVKLDLEIAYLTKLSNSDIQANKATLKAQFDTSLAHLHKNFEFIAKANIGGEFMTPDDQAYVKSIGQSHRLTINGCSMPLLSEEEIYNLSITRGTLNSEERAIINRHMDITVEMLDSLPFPKHLKRVPELAEGHHEKMDGTGYPKKLTREQMSIPARIMAIADIFEALTAADRPYKDAKNV